MHKYALILALGFCSTGLMAQRAQELKPEQITLFSNGTYYLRQEGKLQADSLGKSFLTFPQKPINGTLWIYNTNKDTRISQIDFGEQKLKRSYDAYSLGTLLKGNVGKYVELAVIGDGQNAGVTYSGVILNVKTVEDENNWIVVIKGNIAGKSNIRLIELSQIKNANFAGYDNINMRFEQDSSAVVATVQANKTNTSYRVGMMSLQQGMQWKPSYLLRLESKDKARLSLKATILNDAFDLNEVPVSLVVGNPKMVDNSLDPVVGGVPAAPVVRYAHKRAMPMAMSKSAMYEDADSSPAYVQEEYVTEGTQSEDFYLFNAGKLSLKKDQRSVVPIAQNVVDFEHLYDLGLGQNFNYNESDQPTKTNARHLIKFTNTLDYPLTDGIMMVVDENQSPLAQVSMPYVSKGGDGRVDVANARDVKAEVLETQTKREKNFRTVNKVSYDQLTISCKVKVTNALPKVAKVRAYRVFEGKLVEGDGGKSRVLSTNYGVNDSFNWEITKEMAAGSSMTYEITYKLLAPAREGQ